MITCSRVEIPNIFFSIFFSFIGKHYYGVCFWSFFCGEVTFLCYFALWSTIAFITEMTVIFAVVALVLFIVSLLITASSSSSKVSALSAIVLLLTIFLFLSRHNFFQRSLYHGRVDWLLVLDSLGLTASRPIFFNRWLALQSLLYFPSTILVLIYPMFMGLNP